MLQELRLAWRLLGRQPAFTLVAVGTLALGIGVNVAIFSLVRAVVLRPLPYADSSRLVQIRSVDREDGSIGNLSPADFFDFERGAPAFAALGAHGYVGSVTLTDARGEAERIGGVNVTGGFFPVLGVQPALGRVFRADEDVPGAPLVAMISYDLWLRRFAGDQSIVGRVITINAQPTTVVGVLPADFRHVETNPDRAADIFMPYRFSRTEPNRGGHFIRGVGRLASGQSIAQARASLETLAADLERRYPADNTNLGVLVRPLIDAVVGDARAVLFVLLAAVGLVLLVACANLSNLLLARGRTRQRELAVRIALGAGRARLVRQMLAECLLIAATGATAGLLLGLWTMRALSPMVMATLPRAEAVRLDGFVLAFAVALTLVSTVLVGLIPAVHLSRERWQEALKDGGRQPSSPMRRGAREALIVVEVAVSIVLLIGAGLLIRTLWNLQHVDPGFAASRVMTMDVSLPVARYEEGSQMPFYQRLLDRVRQMPGVVYAGAINILPLSANYDSRGVQVDDAPAPVGQGPSIQARSVTPGYFAAMGVPLVRGRLFDERDDERSQLVVIISASMARQYWPGQDPIGKRITFNSGIPRDTQQVVGGPGSREVVGVVGDVKHLGLDEGVVPMFYTPHTQQPSYHTMTLVIRSEGAAASLVSAVRSELSQMDPGVPLFQVRPLERIVDAAVAGSRLQAMLLSLFAGLALLLASLGVYGVLGYIVSQRRPEIGIRLALGASASAVMRLLVAEGLRPVIAGVAIGCVGAVAASRLLAAMLFAVEPGDVPTYAWAAAVLMTAALAATVVPVRRALRADPLEVLRSE